MRLAAWILLALVLGGCAAPRPALFAVLPAPDGHIGAIVVHGPDGPRVVDTAYGAQRLDAEGRLAPEKLTRAQVEASFGSTLAALPPAPATFTRIVTDTCTLNSDLCLTVVVRSGSRGRSPSLWYLCWPFCT